MAGISAFGNSGKSRFNYLTARNLKDDIAMWNITDKVNELHEVLRRAEDQGDIRLEEFSVAYAFTNQVRASNHYSG